MNTRFVKSLIAVGVLAIASVAPVAAQSGDLQINVPFTFVAGGQKLPAGTYTVQIVDEAGLVMIHSRSGQSATMMTMSSGNYASIDDHAGLFFERNAQGEPVLTKLQFIGQPARLVNSHAALLAAKAEIPVK